MKKGDCSQPQLATPSWPPQGRTTFYWFRFRLSISFCTGFFLQGCDYRMQMSFLATLFSALYMVRSFNTTGFPILILFRSFSDLFFVLIPKTALKI
jgi:hypothetical protein